jgi:CheY-like chemotaxis protein
MSQKARILLVDDLHENLVALEAILAALDQEIVCVRSGAAALDALRSDEFAVILLDVLMPGMDGFETAASIKRYSGTRDVPIIFLTAAGAEPDHAFRGYAAGGVDYIVKPFDPWALRAKVAVFVDLYIKNRQLREQAELLRGHAGAGRTGAGGAGGGAGGGRAGAGDAGAGDAGAGGGDAGAGDGSGLLAEMSRRLSVIEIAAAGLAGLPTAKTDAALADGLVQLDHGIGRLRDTLDALGVDRSPSDSTSQTST